MKRTRKRALRTARPAAGGQYPPGTVISVSARLLGGKVVGTRYPEASDCADPLDWVRAVRDYAHALYRDAAKQYAAMEKLSLDARKASSAVTSKSARDAEVLTNHDRLAAILLDPSIEVDVAFLQQLLAQRAGAESQQ